MCKLKCHCADSLVTTTVAMQWTDKQRAVACRLSPSESHSRLVAKLPRELFFFQNVIKFYFKFKLRRYLQIFIFDIDIHIGNQYFSQAMRQSPRSPHSTRRAGSSLRRALAPHPLTRMLLPQSCTRLHPAPAFPVAPLPHCKTPAL